MPSLSYQRNSTSVSECVFAFDPDRREFRGKLHMVKYFAVLNHYDFAVVGNERLMAAFDIDD